MTGTRPGKKRLWHHQVVARLRCDFHSDVLDLATTMTVLLPEPDRTVHTPAARDEPPPVLYLLHGLSDDDTTLLRRTSLERYVAPLGVAVVLPQVHRSFYTDEVSGGRYWTYLTREVPARVARFFRVSGRREDTFVAGLSMGGYGALRWALRRPDQFAAAVSLSGALNPDRIRADWRRPEDPQMFDRIFGPGPADDLIALLGGPDTPALYVCCGTEDGLYTDSVAFSAACAAVGTPVTTVFGPGCHDWAYWDACIQDVLRWLPLRA